MKYFYTAIAMLAMSLFASAENYRSVAVNLTDGSKVEINLTDKLSAMFTDDDFVVTGGTADVTVPRNQINSFTFSTQSGVNDINSEVNEPVVSGNLMTFDALPDGSTIDIFNTGGKLLFHTVVSGSFTLDLATLATSPVIVKVNNVAYKIATK